MKKNKNLSDVFVIKVLIIALIVLFLGGAVSTIWAVTLPIPDFDSSFFLKKTQIESTKLYDRTGKVLLYDLHGDVKRTIVPLNEISDYAKKATISIEDSNFYKHGGIDPTAIARSIFVDVLSGSKKQGGSTITQQLIKNTLLNNDKSFSRKIKEVILSVKLEQSKTKDEILGLYLNQIPYGGNIYGIEEASQTFFRKKAKDLTLAQSAYVAAIPQAPTHYSPYGNYQKDLVARKNLVLKRMRELGYITANQEILARNEKVIFYVQEYKGIKAPHFDFFIKSYLVEKYGEEVVNQGGLKVITTINWDLQKKAQEIVATYGEENSKKFNADNASLVAIDPKTGQILAMVGSRDYFNTEIKGNYNVATAQRQPGSTFKPIVYATLFNKGYTPDTVLFDLKTQFNTYCSPTGVPLTPTVKATDCYMPNDYDDTFLGPMTIRQALAQSRNIPALKALYLAGVNDSLDTARKMGITSLADKNRYGLTLVLGGGEVSPLELTNAYGVFANDGVGNAYAGILKVEDGSGKVLEEYKQNSSVILPPNTAREISSILSDRTARGANPNTYLDFPGYDVASKTGTTNDFKDAWLVGYSPNIVVGTWVGNSNNKAMEKKVAGYIVTPMWNAFMKEALVIIPKESFIPPDPIKADLKPILRGVWQGGQTVVVDKTTGQPATTNTPSNLKQEQVVTNIHTILYWVDKNDPTGPIPTNPEADQQFNLWEYSIRQWAKSHGYIDQNITATTRNFNTLSVAENTPKFTITSPNPATTYGLSDNITIKAAINSSAHPITQADFFVNDAYLGSITKEPFESTFKPSDIENIKETNSVKVVIYDSVKNKVEQTTSFNVRWTN